MKLVIIFGPQAVGKMTVGHELEKITGLKLFHNHMSIEFVTTFFDYSTPIGRRLVKKIREEIFDEVSSSSSEGMIFTYVWCFDDEGDREYLENLVKIFRDKGADIYYVELEAQVEKRIERNKTPHRLNHKPTKRNIEWSEEQLKKSNLEHRMNSKEGEITEKNYIKIDNTHLEPETVAKIVKEKLKL